MTVAEECDQDHVHAQLGLLCELCLCRDSDRQTSGTQGSRRVQTRHGCCHTRYNTRYCCMTCQSLHTSLGLQMHHLLLLLSNYYITPINEKCVSCSLCPANYYRGSPGCLCCTGTLTQHAVVHSSEAGSASKQDSQRSKGIHFASIAQAVNLHMGGGS